MERFSVTKIVQYRTVVHSRWLETPVSIQCSQIVQRHVQRTHLRQTIHAAQSQQRTVGPPSMERFKVTKIAQYRTVVHSRWLETPVSIQCSQIVQRHVQRITSSAELSRGPEPTEDCWATVNGTLLGNQESSSTEQSSIHGGSRLLSRFSAAKSFSVTCSVVGYSLASHPQWLA